MKTNKILTGLLAIAGLSLLCVTPGRADDAPDGPVTFTGDVAEIMFKHCVQCHRPGQVAPMSFTRYKDIRPWAKSIKNVVMNGEMPPWFAADQHDDFRNDPRLSEDEKKKIVAWINQGAPLGDPYDMPPVPTFQDDAWQIGDPDEIFKMRKPFKMGAGVQDYYANIVVPTNLQQDRWVKEVELKPGNFGIVHHILVFVVPGQLSKVGSGLGGDVLMAAVAGGGLLAKYAPGNNPDVFPPGHGKMIPKGSSLLFQMHYHRDVDIDVDVYDESSMAVKYYDSAEEVEHPVTTAWIVNPMLMIPPGKADIRSSAEFEFIDDGHLHTLFPHMHYRGQAFSFEATYPDGKTEMLLDVPVWDFDWQLTYVYDEPKFMPKGTKIKATGVYDNSAANPYNPDATITVKWGDETTDEMMLGLMDYTYVNLKDQQGMIGLPPGLSNFLPKELQNLTDLSKISPEQIDSIKGRFSF